MNNKVTNVLVIFCSYSLIFKQKFYAEDCKLSEIFTMFPG